MIISAAVGPLGLIGFLLLPPGLAGMVSAVRAGFTAIIELILLVSLPPVIVSGTATRRPLAVLPAVLASGKRVATH